MDKGLLVSSQLSPSASGISEAISVASDVFTALLDDEPAWDFGAGGAGCEGADSGRGLFTGAVGNGGSGGCLSMSSDCAPLVLESFGDRVGFEFAAFTANTLLLEGNCELELALADLIVSPDCDFLS